MKTLGIWRGSAKALVAILAASVPVACGSSSNTPAGPPADKCIETGGAVTTTLCCDSATDFPNTCGVGACACPPQSSHNIQTCDCRSQSRCFDPQRGCVSM